MERLGKYRLLESLGETRYGKLVKARTGLRAYPVAILLIAPEIIREPEQKSQITQRCLTLSGMSHPNLGAVYEFGEEGGISYVVAELLPSRTLWSVLTEKPALSVERKLTILIQAATALDAAHAKGVAHQNLEPGNIHVAGAGTVKIGGFVGGSISDPLSASAGGTADRYLAPEQITDTKGNRSSDIYSLGLIAYEFLTGTHPFSEIRSSAMSEDETHPVRIPTVERFPDLPLGLWPILEKALAPSPGDRFQSAADFAAACQTLLDELAEDAHLMRIELQTELSRLRRAASRPDAPADMARLRTDVEQALLAGDQTSYQQLNRLVVMLAGHYPYLHSSSAAGAPASPPESAGDSAPETNPMFSCMEGIETPAQHEIASVDGIPPLPMAPDRQNQPLAALDLPHDACCQTLPNQEEYEDPSPAVPGLSGMNSGFEPTLTAGVNTEAPDDRTQWEIEHPDHEGAADAPPESLVRESSRKSLLWKGNWWAAIAASVVVVALISVFWLRDHSGSAAAGDFTAVAASRTGTNTDGNLQEGLSRTDPSWSVARRDILMEEARTLHTAGRQEESRVFLIRLLEVNPAYQPALDELNQVEEEIQTLLDQDLRDQTVQQLLASASAAIKAGRMPRAKSDLDRVDSLQPGLAETEALRKRWRTRNEELTKTAAREKEKQQAAEQARRLEELRLRAEELYRHGEYNELRAVIEKEAPEGPASGPIQELLAKATEIQNNLNSFQTALSSGKSSEALRAIENVERINPSDPSLPSLRRRLEKPKADGTAVLSLHPLAEAAQLTVDDKPVGADGKVVNLAIPAGNHKIAARNVRGLQVSQSHEFRDGQEVAFVYDVAAQVLRPMTEADNLAVARNKSRQQVYRFEVEHPHGFLRGSCKGELIVGYYEVLFRPTEGTHGFSVPFKTLHLMVDDRTAILIFASGGKELASFKLTDPSSAQTLRDTWNAITTLDR